MQISTYTIKLLLVLFFFLTSVSLIIVGCVLSDDGCDKKETKCVVISREGYCQVIYVNTTNQLECLYEGEGCGPGLNNKEIDCYVTLESENEISCPKFTCTSAISVVMLILGGFFSGIMMGSIVMFFYTIKPR